MSKFEDICKESFDNWMDSFSTEIPEHEFSQEHTRKMNEIINPERKKPKFKITKGTIRFLLIAAILLSIATTAFANPISREFIKDSTHYIVNVIKKKPIDTNYIPNGFEKSEDFGFTQEYTNDDKQITIKRFKIKALIDYFNEYINEDSLMVKDIVAVYFKTNDDRNGVIYNNGEYAYVVIGNVDKEELLKIAENIK